MKKTTIFFGLTVLAALLISFKVGQDKKVTTEMALATLFENENGDFEDILKKQGEVVAIKASDIEVIEVEEEIDLGLETEEYLPFGFNPYKGFQLEAKDIIVIEDEEEIELGFDVNQYLPTDFNAYKI